MIKARKENLVILGLSDDNMKRLPTAPIKFNMKKDLDMMNIDMVIMSGPPVLIKENHMVVIGLDENDMKLLADGHGIKYDLNKKLGLDCEVVIFNGRTEESMYENMMDQISLEHTILK